ncbi:MAG: DUF4832 domain-containing protein [Anaerolineales bacterium]|nr:DUF4832 domain-containing protein [Anaerolineales bacterium]
MMYRVATKKHIFIGILLCLLVLVSLITLLIINTYSKANRQILQFETMSGPIVNPLMGWAPWANAEESYQPHTLVYADLTWREFEPQEGVYDFATFEQKKQLDRWRREGKRVVFRFVLDTPRDEVHKDIPDWLFEKINREGDYYDNVYGKGFSPNYSNPILINYHKLAVKALGDRYAQDGFFAFVELGSLGHWGEWHTSPEIRDLPIESIRDLYVYHYIDAFPDVHLMMRRPFTIANELDLGLFNDMTGNVSHTTTWLDWIKNGGNYLPGEKGTLVPMMQGWKLAPIGGEQAPDISDQQMYDTDLETTLQLLRESHTTFIGPGSPYRVRGGGLLQDGIDQVLSTIGYRLYLDRVEMPLSVKFGTEIQINFTFSNDGIAPFYYKWPVLLYLFNPNGQMVNTYPLQLNLTEILPGELYDVSFNLPVDSLENGRYMIGVAIIDPMTGQPGVELANKSDRSDLIVEAGVFEVDWLFEFLK